MRLHRINLLLYILIVLSVAACQPVQHQPQPAGITADTLQQPIAGTWYNDDNIFGCMTLTVSDSNRFSFFEAGTTLNRHSSGTVQRDGAHIQFTSDVQYQTETGTQSMHDTALPRKTISGKLPRPGDTLNIYLNNEQYLLEEDTLYKLDRSGTKTDMKFHR